MLRMSGGGAVGKQTAMKLPGRRGYTNTPTAGNVILFSPDLTCSQMNGQEVNRRVPVTSLSEETLGTSSIVHWARGRLCPRDKA